MRTHISKPEVSFRGRPLDPLIVPIVNGNGNTRESLVKAAWSIGVGFDQMMTTIAEATADLGHGRNFQTLKDGDSEAMEARNRLRQRMEVVNALQLEFQQLALTLQRGDA